MARAVGPKVPDVAVGAPGEAAPAVILTSAGTAPAFPVLFVEPMTRSVWSLLGNGNAAQPLVLTPDDQLRICVPVNARSYAG